MQRHINLVLLGRIRNLIDAGISLLLRRQRLHLQPSLPLLFLAEALDASFGSGILRCGVRGCRAQVEWLVEDFVDEDGGGERGRMGLG